MALFRNKSEPDRKSRVRNSLLEPVNEHASPNQVSVPVRPNEENVPVLEKVFLPHNSFRIDLFEIVKRGPNVVLEVAYTDDLDSTAKVDLREIDSIPELSKGAKWSERPSTLGAVSYHAFRKTAEIFSAICSSSSRASLFSVSSSSFRCSSLSKNSKSSAARSAIPM